MEMYSAPKRDTRRCSRVSRVPGCRTASLPARRRVMSEYVQRDLNHIPTSSLNGIKITVGRLTSGAPRRSYVPGSGAAVGAVTPDRGRRCARGDGAREAQPGERREAAQVGAGGWCVPRWCTPESTVRLV